MKILEMHLINFQGVKDKKFILDGTNATFKGDNATGKSTLANAWCWLIFGRPANLEKGWSPKTKDTDGNDIHNVDNVVECKVQLDNNVIVTLRKELKEVWSTPKGTSEQIYKGNTINYSIDGVPAKEKDFIAYLDNVYRDTTIAKILTLPEFFSTDSKENKWEWKERRQLLIDMAGDVSFSDVIEANEELQELPSILLKPGAVDQLYTPDEYINKNKKTLSDLNKKLNDYPGKINEATLAIPDVGNKQRDEVTLDLKVIQKEQENIKAKIDSIKSLSVDTDKENKLINLQIKERKAREAHLNSAFDHNAPIKEQIQSKTDQKQDFINKLAMIGTSIRNTQNDIDFMEKRREELLKNYSKVQTEVFDSTSTICPTCGKPFDHDEVEKMIASFNLNKARKLEEINKSGQTVSKQAIQEEIQRLDAFKKNKEVVENTIKELTADIEKLNMQLIKVIPFEDTESYKSLQEEKHLVKSMSVAEDHTQELEALKQQLDKLTAEENHTRSLLAQFDMVERQQIRISELKQQQKEDAQSYSDLEKGIYLCKQFIVKKISMLDHKISSCFKTIKFKMFEDNISNDGFKEICDVLVTCEQGLVPFSTANNAARINAGLEIINVLNQYFGITTPVFVDNAESVTKLQDISSQVIRLVVDEKYKELTKVEE